MNFKTARINDLEEKLQKTIKDNFYKLNDEPMFKKGLFLFGKTGRGKTHTLYAIYNGLHGDRCSQVNVWQNILYEMKESFGNNSLKDTMVNITDNRFIFLDDVGVEKDSEWSHEMFYMLINNIYTKNKTLFITTNLSLKEFQERYGDRIIDRLTEICDFYEMTGINQRNNN